MKAKPPRRENNSPENWKLGIFYWNPDDPNLIVRHRHGYGAGFNWARPTAWFVMIFLLFIVSIPLVLLFLVRR